MAATRIDAAQHLLVGVHLCDGHHFTLQTTTGLIYHFCRYKHISTNYTSGSFPSDTTSNKKSTNSWDLQLPSILETGNPLSRRIAVGIYFTPNRSEISGFSSQSISKTSILIS
ncbi:hypothetical protein FR483_n455R [Paramecium bursaria Chlorella virus FR483]|uniref:Uncharacterized protein n455R n=1 Tax=Paramecium bursaria Chlorella virus FR483 TaxID=399781 RepID=A7J7F9_PBCVF|nr:hypothetical protein FR483_n455R [Paramecium bursaria Chlorella virus FR483]ABT15740.1 hypothetical protein FR483_n455R [Paramecium bursaria Chlorella virus FR483]